MNNLFFQAFKLSSKFINKYIIFIYLSVCEKWGTFQIYYEWSLFIFILGDLIFTYEFYLMML